MFAIGSLALIALARSGVAMKGVENSSPVHALDAPTEHAVFVDVGSTGSRIHVFRTVGSRVRELGKPLKVQPPLAQLFARGGGPPVEAAFKKLLEHASRTVPFPAHRTTQLHVWGTAGMRSLPPELQRKAWSELYEIASRASPLRVERGQFRTITGAEEGVFSWTAAEHLLVTNGAPAPVGLVEVGGGSVQLVIGCPNVQAEAAATATASAPCRPETRSVAGLGAQAFEKALRYDLAAWAAGASSSSNNVVANPCQFPGDDVAVALKSGGAQRLHGTGDFDECVNLIVSRMESLGLSLFGWGGLPDRAASAGGAGILGVSMLYHATHFLSIVYPSLPFPTPTLEELAARARDLCKRNIRKLRSEYAGRDPHTPVRRMAGRCFDLALTVSLLGNSRGHGLGLKGSERRVRFVDEIGGTEVTWPVGGALSSFRAARLRQHLGALHRPTASVFSYRLALTAAVAVALVMAYRWCRRKLGKTPFIRRNGSAHVFAPRVGSGLI